jgi:hypothetical protein
VRAGPRGARARVLSLRAGRENFGRLAWFRRGQPRCAAIPAAPPRPSASHVFHVTNYRSQMGNYRERLRVPASYWALGLLCAAIMGSTLWAGFSVGVAIAVYAVTGGGIAAALLAWGGTRIEVAGGRLRAGKAVLSLQSAGEVAQLDEARARAMRGPRADPAAFLLIRPYLKLAVYIETSGRSPAQPYWLIATRHPAELAAAIERSRPAARTGGSPVG